MTVHFEAEALEEYKDAVLHSERRFGMGERFVQAVEAALESIVSDPERFQNIGQSIRVFRMRRFPYCIYYHYAPPGEAVTIYAIAHNRRDSGYWHHRVP